MEIILNFKFSSQVLELQDKDMLQYPDAWIFYIEIKRFFKDA